MNFWCSYVYVKQWDMRETFLHILLTLHEVRCFLVQKEQGWCYNQGGSNFETIFSTRVFATIFSLFEMFVLTISSPYQKKESYVNV